MNLDMSLENAVKNARMHGCIDAFLDLIHVNAHDGSVQDRMECITRYLRALSAKLKEEAAR